MAKYAECEPDVMKGMFAGLVGGIAGSVAMNLFHMAVETFQQRQEESERQEWKTLGQPPSTSHIQMSSHPAAEGGYWPEEGMSDHPDYQDQPTSAPPPLSRDQAGDSATVRTAEAISEKIAGHHLTWREKEIAEPIVHYSFGSLLGMTYGMGTEFMPYLSFGEGAVFGAAVMVATEEVASPLLKLSRPPQQHAKSAHLYSLFSHLIYGLVCETVRKAVRRMLID